MLQEPGSQAPARCSRGTAEGFSAALRTGLEKDLLRPVLDHFDLVLGISTGARSPSLSSPPFLLPDRRVDLCRPYRRSVPPVVRPACREQVTRRCTPTSISNLTNSSAHRSSLSTFPIRSTAWPCLGTRQSVSSLPTIGAIHASAGRYTRRDQCGLAR